MGVATAPGGLSTGPQFSPVRREPTGLPAPIDAAPTGEPNLAAMEHMQSNSRQRTASTGPRRLGFRRLANAMTRSLEVSDVGVIHNTESIHMWAVARSVEARHPDVLHW